MKLNLKRIFQNDNEHSSALPDHTEWKEHEKFRLAPKETLAAAAYEYILEETNRMEEGDFLFNNPSKEAFEAEKNLLASICGNSTDATVMDLDVVCDDFIRTHKRSEMTGDCLKWTQGVDVFCIRLFVDGRRRFDLPLDGLTVNRCAAQVILGVTRTVYPNALMELVKL